MIACVLLLVVSFTVCWYWPRGDARFVGRWERHPGGGETMVLLRNGTAYFIYESSSSPGNEMDWSVVGDQLVLGAQSRIKIDFLRFIKPAYRIVTGKLPYDVQNRLLILSVTPEELRIRDPRGYEITYRRVPE